MVSIVKGEVAYQNVGETLAVSPTFWYEGGARLHSGSQSLYILTCFSLFC